MHPHQPAAIPLTDNQTRVRDALPPDGAATPADIAEATGLAYSTVTRLLRELAELGAAVKDAEGWHHPKPADSTTEPATSTAEPPEPAADAAVTVTEDRDTTKPVAAADTPAPRQPPLAKGQLQDQVLAALRAATGPLGPTQLSKILHGRSQGAISNACDRLIARGDAILASEQPRRFLATPTT